MSISGIQFSGSFVALITPMLSNGDIDFDNLRKLVDWHVQSGTNGLVVLGTTAETSTLSDGEQIAVLSTVIEQNKGQLPILVGNGTNSTRTTIAKTQQLAELNIDGFLTVTPYYNRPSQDGMVAHYKAVANSTDKPIILYNVPPRTGVDLDNDSVFELMDVDNIVGIKDATGDLLRVAQMKEKNPEFILLSGDDLTAQHYIAQGGHGVISVTANVEPQLMSDMVKSTLTNAKDASLLDEKLLLLHRDLFIESNPAPTKYALKEKGMIVSDAVRLPLLPLSAKNHSVIKQAIIHAQ